MVSGYERWQGGAGTLTALNAFCMKPRWWPLPSTPALPGKYICAGWHPQSSSPAPAPAHPLPLLAKEPLPCKLHQAEMLDQSFYSVRFWLESGLIASERDASKR